VTEGRGRTAYQVSVIRMLELGLNWKRYRATTTNLKKFRAHRVRITKFSIGQHGALITVAPSAHSARSIKACVYDSAKKTIWLSDLNIVLYDGGRTRRGVALKLTDFEIRTASLDCQSHTPLNVLSS
jgi:hypothetical protein